jgi:Holliday junction DNA helicase RuvB
MHGHGTVGELARAFCEAEFGDFVFIDEAHNLSSKAQELLYEVIDLCQLPNWATPERADGDELARAGHLEQCSIILASDQPGRLHNALLKRLGFPVNLGFYSVRELRPIVDRLAIEVGVLFSPQAANLIAKVSRGLPRQVRQHLENLQLHFAYATRLKLSLTDVRRYLRQSDIDTLGLTRTDRTYLRYLRDCGRASVESLAICLGQDADYLRRQIEPQLLMKHLIAIRPGGRALTERGQSYLSKRKAEKQNENVNSG